MDRGTTDDYIADLMMEAAIARASLEHMTIDRDRLMRLVRLFNANYVCLWCDGWGAKYLNDCTNELHALHDAVEGLGDPNE